jgi:hypothetical protein
MKYFIKYRVYQNGSQAYKLFRRFIECGGDFENAWINMALEIDGRAELDAVTPLIGDKEVSDE